MKKTSNLKKAAALILATGTLFAASCSAKQPTAAGEFLAEPDGRDYTFIYPSDWSVLRDDSMYAIESPSVTVEKKEKTSNISVLSAVIHDKAEDYVSVEETELLEAYVPQYMEMVKAEFGSTEYDGNIQDVEISGKTGKKVTYSYKDPFTEEEFFFETVFAILKTNSFCYCYYLTYTANGKEAFDAYHGGFEKVIASFDFN